MSRAESPGYFSLIIGGSKHLYEILDYFAANAYFCWDFTHTPQQSLPDTLCTNQHVSYCTVPDNTAALQEIRLTLMPPPSLSSA